MVRIQIVIYVLSIGLLAWRPATVKASVDETSTTTTPYSGEQDVNAADVGTVNFSGCKTDAIAACGMITIFVTGNELGELRPCGCSSGQLGGFDRRATLFNAVRPDRRFILDTGSLLKEQTDQSLLKLITIMQAFDKLGYDVVSLTKQDMAAVANMGFLGNTSFTFIAAQNPADANLPQMFSRQMELDGKLVTLAIVAVNTDESSIDSALRELAAVPADAAIKIVIFDGSEDEAQIHLADLERANVVIAKTNADEPAIIKKTDKGMLLVSAGRLGKYVGRLNVRRAKEGGGFELTYKSLAVDANLAQSPALIDNYKMYQGMVKDQNLLEKYPKLGLPDGLQYVGSHACGLKGCHDYEYGMAITQKHEHAIESLVLAGSDHDPECVKCHVVGMEYQSGFITEERTPDLKGVGCETCHGPGSQHLVTAGKAKTTKPQLKCLDCHTAEQSVNYAGREKEYEKKIVHWREPNTPKIVK